MTTDSAPFSIDEIFMKPNILFFMHMPPPVHGAAMVGLSTRTLLWFRC